VRLPYNADARRPDVEAREARGTKEREQAPPRDQGPGRCQPRVKIVDQARKDPVPFALASLSQSRPSGHAGGGRWGSQRDHGVTYGETKGPGNPRQQNTRPNAPRRRHAYDAISEIRRVRVGPSETPSGCRRATPDRRCCWSGAVCAACGGQGIRTPEDGLGTALAVFKTVPAWPADL
jgi:hypothetical protein